LAGQFAVRAHLAASPGNVYPELSRPIEELPLEFTGPTSIQGEGRWVGAHLPDIDRLRERLKFQVDGLLSRAYRPTSGGPEVGLYAVYSRIGDDRKHHPEVCVRDVAGAPEDRSARAIVYLDSDNTRGVMRFRFRTRSDGYTTIYYWHYTLPAVSRAEQTFIQRLHQRLQNPAPSMTVQVSAFSPLEALAPVEKELIPALDEAIRKDYLPTGARIACDRLPIGLVRE
jgi:hypothetical protein